MIKNFVQGITFKELQPWRAPKVSENANWDFECDNVTFPIDDSKLKERLHPLKTVVTNKYCTMTIAGIINKAVELMPKDSVYLNVGFWKGYSLFAGYFGNNRTCIGVDNFSENNMVEFTHNFNKLNPKVIWHNMFYQEYFESVHKEPIGVYYYDGPHDHRNQYDGLVLAKKYFVDGTIIIVDDANWTAPVDSTMRFLEENLIDYEVIFNVRTATNAHPTFWNGLMILRKKIGG